MCWILRSLLYLIAMIVLIPLLYYFLSVVHLSFIAGCTLFHYEEQTWKYPLLRRTTTKTLLHAQIFYYFLIY